MPSCRQQVHVGSSSLLLHKRLFSSYLYVQITQVKLYNYHKMIGVNFVIVSMTIYLRHLLNCSSSFSFVVDVPAAMQKIMFKGDVPAFWIF